MIVEGIDDLEVVVMKIGEESDGFWGLNARNWKLGVNVRKFEW